MSDWQLRRFKSDPGNRGRICEEGFWSLSRHPNYFFEWLCWLAYPLIAIDLTGANPLGWIALLAPACMYWVLVTSPEFRRWKTHAALAWRAIS